MATLKEHIARHRGSRAPRTKTIGDAVFHSIYLGAHGSYWIAEREDGEQAFVRDQWRRYSLDRETHTIVVTVGKKTISDRFRNEDRAFNAAAKALRDLPGSNMLAAS